MNEKNEQTISVLNNFLLQNQTAILNLYNIYFSKAKDFSYKNFIDHIYDDLYNQCLNTNKNNFNLLYDISQHCKNISKSKNLNKNTKEYVCPGCLFLGEENLLYKNKYLECSVCEEKLQLIKDEKWSYFFNTFKKHNLDGIKCIDCNRFIPQPILNKDNIICPYIDCMFAGNIINCKNMQHPFNSSSKGIAKKKYFYKTINFELPINLNNNFVNCDKKQIISSYLNEKIITLNWSKRTVSNIHKIYVYKAFLSLLDKDEYLINYLYGTNKYYGFQAKIFQEYYTLIKNDLPLIIFKNKQNIIIQSILDSNLNIFDGLSNFTSIVDHNLVCKNNTTEIYIGNRESYYVKPYFIGSILNAIDIKTHKCILDCIEFYNFNKIQFKNIEPGTEVSIVHLRLIPHYQSGIMSYVNRIKKEITQFLLK